MGWRHSGSPRPKKSDCKNNLTYDGLNKVLTEALECEFNSLTVPATSAAAKTFLVWKKSLNIVAH
jgi:hypothetical protein